MFKKAASAAVTPEEVRALRDELEETQEQLAATLGVTVREVRAWEAGTLAVPREEGQWIRHFLGLNARSRAAAEAGIVDCPWIEEWDKRRELALRKGKTAELGKLATEVHLHEERCPQCIHVAAWIATQPPVPPAPGPGGILGILGAFIEWVQSLPAWLRPAAYGMAIFGGVTLLRVVLLLLLDGPPFAEAGEALKAVLMGSALGAIGGLTWAAVREPLRPLGRARPFVGGAVLGAVGAIVMLVFLTLSGDPEMSLKNDPYAWMMVPIGALISALLLGFTILREDKDG